jgi:hypothetical protein
MASSLAPTFWLGFCEISAGSLSQALTLPSSAENRKVRHINVAAAVFRHSIGECEAVGDGLNLMGARIDLAGASTPALMAKHLLLPQEVQTGSANGARGFDHEPVTLTNRTNDPDPLPSSPGKLRKLMGSSYRGSTCSNRRLVEPDDTGVACRWNDYRTNGPGRWKTMQLHPHEFITRFLAAHAAQGASTASATNGLFASANRAKTIVIARALRDVDHLSPTRNSSRRMRGA